MVSFSRYKNLLVIEITVPTLSRGYMVLCSINLHDQHLFNNLSRERYYYIKMYARESYKDTLTLNTQKERQDNLIYTYSNIYIESCVDSMESKPNIQFS